MGWTVGEGALRRGQEDWSEKDTRGQGKGMERVKEGLEALSWGGDAQI